MYLPTIGRFSISLRTDDTTLPTAIAMSSNQPTAFCKMFRSLPRSMFMGAVIFFHFCMFSSLDEMPLLTSMTTPAMAAIVATIGLASKDFSEAPIALTDVPIALNVSDAFGPAVMIFSNISPIGPLRPNASRMELA